MPSPSRRITTARPLDMAATLAPLRHGGLDPAYRTAQDGTVWRATLVASGSATLSLKQVGPQSIDACVWGDGADEVWAGLPALLGELDDIPPFDPVPGPVRDAYRRYRNVRVPRSGRVLEALIPTILE
ncbi:MAG TPA: DNA-3-methyladenine glycosylase 2 family protein, partial [Propionicimonas sp.]